MSRFKKAAVVFFGSLCLFLSLLSISGADSPKTYDAEGIYDYAQKSVFYVRVFRSDGTLKDVGTGFLVNKEGAALTAYHVVKESDRIACVLYDGTVVNTCRVVSQDETTDTAVLKLSPKLNSYGQAEDYAFITLRTSKVKHGEQVFAIGYPMKETKIITEGIVNTPRALINGRDRILVSAQVVNGMSGGPILDKYGYAAGHISGSLRTMNNIHLVVNTEDIKMVLTDKSYQVK